MNNTVFLFPQFQHDLIPKAHFPEEDLELAREMKAFWFSMFQLFQQKTDEITSAYPNEENQDRLYLKIRPVLDEEQIISWAFHASGSILPWYRGLG